MTAQPAPLDRPSLVRLSRTRRAMSSGCLQPRVQSNGSSGPGFPGSRLAHCCHQVRQNRPRGRNQPPPRRQRTPSRRCRRQSKLRTALVSPARRRISSARHLPQMSHRTQCQRRRDRTRTQHRRRRGRPRPSRPSQQLRRPNFQRSAVRTVPRPRRPTKPPGTDRARRRCAPRPKPMRGLGQAPPSGWTKTR